MWDGSLHSKKDCASPLAFFFRGAYKVAMTKAQLKRRLRALNEPDTNRAIAAIFRIKEQAVQAWPPHAKMPELRILQLQKMRPELFA